MRVVKAPSIQFTCYSCTAVCEGEPHEFEELHTMPPSFRAQCAFCGALNTCFPTALIARAAGGFPAWSVIEVKVRDTRERKPLLPPPPGHRKKGR